MFNVQCSMFIIRKQLPFESKTFQFSMDYFFPFMCGGAKKDEHVRAYHLLVKQLVGTMQCSMFIIRKEYKFGSDSHIERE